MKESEFGHHLRYTDIHFYKSRLKASWEKGVRFKQHKVVGQASCDDCQEDSLTA